VRPRPRIIGDVVVAGQVGADGQTLQILGDQAGPVVPITR
jgi:hypothetical protein